MVPCQGSELLAFRQALAVTITFMVAHRLQKDTEAEKTAASSSPALGRAILFCLFSSIFVVACAGEGRGGDLDRFLWESNLQPELVQHPGSVFLMVFLTVLPNYV